MVKAMAAQVVPGMCCVRLGCARLLTLTELRCALPVQSKPDKEKAKASNQSLSLRKSGRKPLPNFTQSVKHVGAHVPSPGLANPH